MWLEFLAILAGFALLVWSADHFVNGAAALANNLGVSTLVIGLTVVGFGTSAPEILVALTAALDGNAGLAIGNAVGSNIANVGLILGLTALVIPLSVSSQVLRREYPILLIVTITALILVIDGELGFYDGLILIFMLAGVLFLMWRVAVSGSAKDPLLEDLEAEIPHAMPTSKALLWLASGLLLLVFASKILVWGSVEVASWLGVSDLVIGLTIVALGTSLPELATSMASALKGEPDLALGNVIGSNLYNLLAVFSIPGLIAPGAVDSVLLTRDMPAMMVLTFAIVGLAWTAKGVRHINRIGGLLLLIGYASYQGWIIYSSLA
ncbi:calcium/sodium antiporter [Solemya elarraichensis gill symbiont]|uniref:Calcium/sodium antiporter n=1 Tax=Solemya elarraichensis gill symbiont TaxID=1918949 RepID=A0A1T2LBZ9_9GAMM|nr:calcium/sodium antiporter [Solemya elarraichensis gill symbiont]OOZ42611.1 calcium/sodium antiporter [Solemya elarraichensis gill symbiont]